MAQRAAPADHPDDNDPQLSAAREQLTPLWNEWLEVFEQPTQSDKAYTTFLGNLQTAGWLRPDAKGSRFFKIVIELALTAAAPSTPDADAASKPAVAFAPLDALSTLLVQIIKHVPVEIIKEVEKEVGCQQRPPHACRRPTRLRDGHD